MPKKQWVSGGWAAIFAAALLGGCVSNGGGGQPSSVQFENSPIGPGSSETEPAERRIESSGRVPDFVRKAVRNTPEDAWVGIGTARFRTISQSRTFAATRARDEIARQLGTQVSELIRDFVAADETNLQAGAAYQESFSRAITNQDFSGAAVVDEDEMSDGNYWVVVMMPKNDVGKIVADAASQAKQAVSGLAGGRQLANDLEAKLDGHLGTQKKIEVLTAENSELQSKLNSAQNQAEKAQNQSASLVTQVATLQNQLSQTEQDALRAAQAQAAIADAADAKARDLKRQAEELKAELNRKGNQTQEDRENLVRAQGEADRARDEAAAEKLKSNDLKNQLNQAQRQVAQKEDELKASQEEASKLKAELARSQGQLAQAQQQQTVYSMPNLSWTGPWSGGGNSRTSNRIGNSASTWETLSINAPQPCYIEIRIIASCEQGGDFGYATYLDSSPTTGSNPIVVTGTQTGHYRYTVPAGSHSINFGYVKNWTGQSNNDSITVEVGAFQYYY
jgi:predicted  nucleic acid-binding Zn-ribbon protein